MISVKNLFKGYEKGKDVLCDMGLEIPEKQVFGLVGINGAGKSTLLRLIAGVLRADKGQVCVDGEEVYENERVKKEIFFLPDDPYYASGVTAKELAAIYQSLYAFDEETFYGYLQTFSLNADKPIRNFSKGMKRQVFVALALAVKPKYLLLDEAFDGLDPLARITLKKGLMKMVEDCGSTVIISSHSLRELEDICQGYALLDKGNIIVSGQESTLKNLHKFQAAFTAPVSREDFPFVCDSYQKVGSVVRLVAKGDREELLRAIQTLSPLFVEEIDVDFEELFIGEVTQRGYLQ